MTELFAIAGLGNPGLKYAETRHNAGFWFLEEVARLSEAKLRLNGKLLSRIARVLLHGRECVLVQPDTFMNESGLAIRAVIDYFQIPARNLLIGYDELDLPAGVVRLKVGGGHGGHNGLRDVFRHTEDHSFLRLRFGIGHPGAREAVLGHVLGRPSRADEALIRGAVARAVAVLPEILNGDLPKAMQLLHTDKDIPERKKPDGV